MALSSEQYTVSSNTGTVAARGAYAYDSEYNGRHCYKNANGYYLWCGTAGWNLSSTKGGTPLYVGGGVMVGAVGTQLCANSWTMVMGSSPAPTVTFTAPRVWAVTGAGTAALNQNYTYTGETNQASYFQSADGNYWLC